MKSASRWRTTFNSLENRDYRWYWCSSMFAAAVLQMNLMARSWLVFDLTDSFLQLGIVSFIAGMPLFVLSPFGGTVADRFDKRNLILLTQLLMAVIVLVIALLIYSDVVEVWHLYAAGFFNGILLAVNLPSRQSIVPQLVERRLVMNAVALSSGAQNMNRIVAPALAGVMIGVIGMAGVYFLIVVFAIVSAILMLFIASKGSNNSVGWKAIIEETRAGLQYVFNNQKLRVLVIMAIVPIVFGMPYLMLMSGYAQDVLDADSEAFGGLLSAAGVGAVIGSVVIAALTDYKRKGLLLMGAAVLFGSFLILFSSTTNFVMAILLMTGVGFGNACYMSVNNSLLLLNSEERMHGRVMSLYMMSIAVMPMAVLPMGALSEVAGAPVVIGGGGAIIVLFTLSMALFRPALRKMQ